MYPTLPAINRIRPTTSPASDPSFRPIIATTSVQEGQNCEKTKLLPLLSGVPRLAEAPNFPEQASPKLYAAHLKRKAHFAHVGLASRPSFPSSDPTSRTRAANVSFPQPFAAPNTISTAGPFFPAHIRPTIGSGRLFVVQSFVRTSTESFCRRFGDICSHASLGQPGQTTNGVVALVHSPFPPFEFSLPASAKLASAKLNFTGALCGSDLSANVTVRCHDRLRSQNPRRVRPCKPNACAPSFILAMRLSRFPCGFSTGGWRLSCPCANHPVGAEILRRGIWIPSALAKPLARIVSNPPPVSLRTMLLIRGVGLQRRASIATALPRKSPFCSSQTQHEDEHLGKNRLRQALRMMWSSSMHRGLFRNRNAQECPQSQTVGTTPGNANAGCPDLQSNRSIPSESKCQAECQAGHLLCNRLHRAPHNSSKPASASTSLSLEVRTDGRGQCSVWPLEWNRSSCLGLPLSECHVESDPSSPFLFNYAKCFFNGLLNRIYWP